MLDEWSWLRDLHAKWSKRWTEQLWGVLMCDVMLDEWSWWRDLMRSDRRGGQRDLWEVVRSVDVWCDVGWVKLVERFDAKWSKRWTEQLRKECWCVMWCWMSEVGGEIWCEVIEEVDRTVLRSVDVWCDVGWVKLVERFDAKWSKRWTEQLWGSVHVWCDVGWVKLVERFDAKWSKRWTEQWWGVLMCDVMLDEWSWWRDLMRSDRRGGQNSDEECSCVMWCWMSEVGGEIWCEVIEEVDRTSYEECSCVMWCWMSEGGWEICWEVSKRWTEQS